MRKYRVIYYYTASEVYEVDAESKKDAIAAVNNGLEPVTSSGQEFSEYEIEEMEE